MSAASSGLEPDPNYGSRFRELCSSDFPELASPKVKRSRPTSKTSSQATGKPFPFTQDAPTGFPEFFIIQHNEPTKDLKMASCFLINKAIENHIGPGSTTKRLRDGTLLTKVINKKQAQLVTSLQSLGGIIDVKVREHPTLNHSKGVIYCFDLKHLSEEEILDGLKGQKVTEVKKMNKKINGEWVGTGSVIVTFKASTIPTSLDVGIHRVQCKQYIPSPMRCLNCFKYGHPKKYCKSNRICALCSKEFHEGDCETGSKCANCDENHNNWSKDCQRFKTEQEIQRIVAVDKISIVEARKKFRINYPNFSYPTYASAANGIALPSHSNSNSHTVSNIIIPNTQDSHITQNRIKQNSTRNDQYSSSSSIPTIYSNISTQIKNTVIQSNEFMEKSNSQQQPQSQQTHTPETKYTYTHSNTKTTDPLGDSLPIQNTPQTNPIPNKIKSTINENITQILQKK